MSGNFGDKVAPDGQLYVCGACGKTSKDLFGNQKISYGWDESCTLNAVLCYETKVNGVHFAVETTPDDPPTEWPSLGNGDT